MRNSNWGQSCMYMIEDCDFYNFFSRTRLWLEVICGSHCLSISSSSLIRNSSTPDQWKFISLHSCKIFCTIMWKWAELTVERKERTLEWNFLSWCLCTFFQFGNSAAQHSNTDFIVQKMSVKISAQKIWIVSIFMPKIRHQKEFFSDLYRENSK